MLELRPNCERCDVDLAPAAPNAVICTFECTWCSDCAQTFAEGLCPNCGGNLVPRPIRPAHLLAKYPPSAERVVSGR